MLAALLVAMAALQLFVTREPEIPEAPFSSAARVARYGAPAAPRVDIPQVILARPLFAPRRAETANPVAAALGGAMVAGSVAYRGRSRAVLRQSDGSIRYVPVGGSVAGWRLIALQPDFARFAKGGQRLDVAYGAAGVAPPDPSAEEEEDVEEEEAEE